MSTHPAYVPTEPVPTGLSAIEASAGTGKTFSISSVVARLVVEHDIGLDRFLVVTFTRAATAELAERVRGRLGEVRAVLAGEQEPGDEVLAHLLVVGDGLDGGRAGALRRVERALREVDDAAITTLHGFCQGVLQRAALAADAEPLLTVDDDREASLLLAQVVGDWQVALVRDAPPAALAALGMLQLGTAGLLALARTVVGETSPRLLPGDLPTTDPHRLVVDAVEGFASALVRGAAGDAAWLEAHAKPLDARMRLGPVKLPAAREQFLATLARGLVPARRELVEYLPAAVEASKRLAAAGAEPPPLTLAVEQFLADLTEVERTVRLQLAHHARTEMAGRRSEQGRTGFEGLLRAVDEALQDPTTRAELQAAVGDEHTVVLVDEFQDTDPVQWRILRRLFDGAEHTVVVGDPKQAIYGWRGADLHTYLEAVAEAEATGAVRTMGTNWRSDGAYVAACNHLLGRGDPFGTADHGEHQVAYVEVGTPTEHAGARLRAADGTPRSGIVLAFHERSDDTPIDLGTGRRRVAAWTAEDVVATLRAGWELPDADGTPRGVRPDDCVVLVRTNKEARLVAAALRERGVLPTLGGGQDVFAADEAAAVEHLLAALLDRGRERLVRRVLVGPFGAFDAVELDQLGEAGWESWAERLRGWHATWERHGVAALLERAARDGGAERRLAARPDGERILTNVRHLAELLHAAARDEALGTHALLGWLRARRADALADQGRAPVERELRLERDDHAVRVLTVHAAKGLEFPLVWAPYLWSSEVRPRTATNRPAPFVVNDDESDGGRTVVLHPSALLARDSEAPEELQRLWRAKDLAEWQAGLRLAYVALTRAVHRCVVDVGCFKDVRGSAAWHLLHAAAGHERYEPGERLGTVTASDAELLAPLEELAAHPSIGVDPRAAVDPPRTRWTAPDTTTAADLVHATWSGRSLDRAWGRTSYTRMLDRRTAPAPGDATVEDARDHDADVDDAGGPVATGGSDVDRLAVVGDPGASVPLQDVPRGAAWGTFLHGVLEHADFDADEAVLLDLVREQARQTSLPVAAAHHATVAHGLHRALSTPLGPDLDDLALASVGRADRLDELRFTLALADPAHPVDVGRLAAVLEEHADAAPGVPLAAVAAHLRAGGDGLPVHGLLVGAIDLVLRQQRAAGPCWWVVDYKSNGLGTRVEADDGTTTYVERAADHHPDLVLASMVDHDYLLQAHLYVVALHRFLRSRLGAAYDYDEHVGGYGYLYLRGMTGPQVRRTDDGRVHGVVTGHPDRALVEALDAVLRPGTAA